MLIASTTIIDNRSINIAIVYGCSWSYAHSRMCIVVDYLEEWQALSEDRKLGISTLLTMHCNGV